MTHQTTTLLSTAQKKAFTRNGFLVLSDVIDSELIERAYAAVLADNDVDSEGELRQELEEDSMEWDPDAELFCRINEEIFEYVEELVGADLIEPPSSPDFSGGVGEGKQSRIGLRPPRPEQLTDDAAVQPSELSSHVDNLTHEFDDAVFAVGAAIYLNHIQPRGGGFTVWPGSHWYTAKFFEDHPMEDAVNKGIPALTEDGEWSSERELDEVFDPFEISGDAGTVVLWTGSIEHTAGPRPSPGSVRMAAFSRFFTKRGLVNPQEAVAEDPYSYWTGMDDIELDITRPA